MRDRDAIALARATHERLGKLAELLGPARARLRSWSADGFERSGEGGGSSQEYPDPVARAVQSSEVVRNVTDPKTGKTIRAKHVGWRDTDEHAHQLRELDKRLVNLDNEITDFAAELAALLTDPEVIPEEGCALCDIVRLPIDDIGVAHRCDHECASRNHRHPNSHQPIYSRRAPRHPRADELTEDDPQLADRARCKWHYDFAKRHGKDAPGPLSLWHLDNPDRRLPNTLLRQHHLDPDAEQVAV